MVLTFSSIFPSHVMKKKIKKSTDTLAAPTTLVRNIPLGVDDICISGDEPQVSVLVHVPLVARLVVVLREHFHGLLQVVLHSCIADVVQFCTYMTTDTKLTTHPIQNMIETSTGLRQISQKSITSSVIFSQNSS